MKNNSIQNVFTLLSALALRSVRGARGLLLLLPFKYGATDCRCCMTLFSCSTSIYQTENDKKSNKNKNSKSKKKKHIPHVPCEIVLHCQTRTPLQSPMMVVCPS